MSVATPRVIKEVLKDIENALTELRKIEMLRDETGVSTITTGANLFDISYATKNETSSILYDNNISYSFLIDKLLFNRQYTILLYDKSIVQAEFKIANNIIIKERLLFIKKHNKTWQKDEIAEYENEYEEWFDDDFGIPIFFRVDYDPDAFKEVSHPATHFTLSNQENCRIPIKGIITFSEFMKLIMKQFYNIDLSITQYRYNDETITNNEKKLIHMNWV